MECRVCTWAKLQNKLPVKHMKIILLASEGISTNIIYNAISRDFTIDHVIIEKSVKITKFLKYRYKKVGFFRMLDQLLFILTISKLLTSITKNRKAAILFDNGLNNDAIPDNKIIRVSSANNLQTIDLLNEFSPDIILVNGTRILSKKLLAATNAKFVNLHAGITPDYRGVHGAYWAYVNKDPDMAGVTLHYVDSGVDTGKIIGQIAIDASSADNFATYPLIQLAAGTYLLTGFLNNLIHSKDFKPEILSKGIRTNQWYHPGFFEYLYHRLFNGVK